MKRAVCGLAVLCIISGCAKKETIKPVQAPAVPAAAPAPTLPSVPVATTAPESLLAEVTLPEPERNIGRLGELADAIKPGSGALVSPATLAGALAGMLGASSLDGLDLARPVRVLVLDPKTQPKPLVLVASVADEKVLLASVAAAPGLAVRVHEGHAAVATETALLQAGDYALTQLLGQPLPAEPTVNVYLERVATIFRGELDMFKNTVIGAMKERGGHTAAVVEAELAFFEYLVDQSERLVVTLEAAATGASLDFALVPRAGATIASFYAAQQPSDYALLGKLPAADVVMFAMAGRVVLGPWREPALAFVGEAWEKITGKKLGPELLAGFVAMADASTGESAGVGSLGPKGDLRAAMLWGTTDPTGLHQVTLSMLAGLKALGKIDLLGDKVSYDVKPTAFKYDGVAVTEYTTSFDFSETKAKAVLEKLYGGKAVKGHLGAFDGFMVSAFGKSSDAFFKAAVDSARRGKNRFDPGLDLAAALTDSRARKESFVMYMALGEIMRAAQAAEKKQSFPVIEGPAGMVFALGFADGSAHFRMTLPAALGRALSVARPAGAAE